LKNLTFSQRKGLMPVRETIQMDHFDEPTTNALWNVQYKVLWRAVDFYTPVGSSAVHGSIISLIWQEAFEKPIDTIPDSNKAAIERIRKFFFDVSWNRKLDFIEFVVEKSSAIFRGNLERQYNETFEKYLVGYRFVNLTITDITAKDEIESIESALTSRDVFKNCSSHVQDALILYSDRDNPNYRNSIKESISAVEAACNVIAGMTNATLGDALKEVEKVMPLHGALKSAFDKLYGYTSDANGIRHALMDESNLKSEDAKFMLIACSAFVNYLKEKHARINK
jgi:hypothetical protein